MSLRLELHDTTMEAQPLTLSQDTEPTPFNESPIQNLPPELLEEIFDLCASSDLLPDLFRTERWLPSLRLAFSQVCCNWRSISLSSPRLWRRIDISFPRLAKEFLTRSGTRSLQVVAEPLSRGIKLCDEDLKLHAGRITSFDIYFLDRGELVDLFKDLQSDLAGLTTLSLKDDDTIYAGTTFIHLPPLVHVKKLELHNVSIPWHTCSGGSLTSLILRGLEPDLLTVSQLYDIFHCSPKLEYIELKHIWTDPFSRVDGQPPSPASLPHLHKLTLQAPGHFIYDILSGISLPPDTRIEITHTRSDIAPDSNDKISSLTPLTRSPSYVLHSELTTLRIGDDMIRLLTEGAQPWSEEPADTRFSFSSDYLHPQFFFHTAHTMFFHLSHFRTLELGKHLISPIPSGYIVEFLAYATNLETLRIARTDLHQLSEALSQPRPPPAAVGDGDLGMGTQSRLVCPNLRRILLGYEGRWPFSEILLRHIVDIARVRHEASIPLAVVELNVKPKGTMKLMEELRRYVARVVEL
ncbi:hypothetical protein D9615_002053 [Tricholomella constricta]|uniref:F-box domain-containing protein n=1 Tax=Tricholomella constricta TaxID=117010 RepID=A0A8H5HPG2_9AGAR|nr:hypothetical protein D9615_002053 [Tricholomella constricta]